MEDVELDENEVMLLTAATACTLSFYDVKRKKTSLLHLTRFT